ncbi:MAG: hypothetical protein IJ960_02720 [Oscillospiraceae bacterium]|nr:hypothetical protein [Oscillospiraceae bacterium]
MEKPDIKKGWDAFLRWKGWKAAAAFCGKGWSRMIRWSGWKRLFGLPPLCLAVLSVGCAVGLVWVFSAGLESSLLGYCLYPLSAYCLTALCVRLPGAARHGNKWMADHPRAAAVLRPSDRKFTRNLYRDQIINFAYGSYKIGAGIVYGSAWIGCDGIYNLAQALIQLFQILRRKQARTLELQWRAYRFCGVLILLMHLTLIGLVFQMVNWNRAVEQGEILVITTAFFAFYKIITSFVFIAKDRKHARPVDSSVRMLNLAQAFFAIFSLQASMFHTFGTGESWEHGMNILTGCAVCLSVVSIGIYMIRRGNREIKQLHKEKDNGTESIL